MSLYNLTYDTGDLKRADEAIKIAFVRTNERLVGLGLPPYESPDTFLVEQVRQYVVGLVQERFTQPRLNKILDALPLATDDTITNVGRDLGIDLDIAVPNVAKS